MTTLKGTKEELEKLADEINRLTGVDDIVQLDIGGGIHGGHPALTRGEPYTNATGEVVYVLDKCVDAETLAAAIDTTDVTVVEKEVNALVP